jgi:hypothetical protein
VYGYRKGSREPRYLDDEEIRRRDEEQKEEVEEYNRFRDQFFKISFCSFISTFKVIFILFFTLAFRSFMSTFKIISFYF